VVATSALGSALCLDSTAPVAARPSAASPSAMGRHAQILRFAAPYRPFGSAAAAGTIDVIKNKCVG
jgi:hypothetical protein